MEVMYPRCCGLDVHKKTVVACRRVQVGRQVQRDVRTFGTTTGELRALAAWLAEAQCTHAAMESTGVYWRPIWNVLEGACTLLLANARDVKAVPGRKTDVKDCEWLAELLAHGLIRASFVPEAPMRARRDLTRYRKTLIRTRASEINRVHKLLEGANIKLGSVATDVLGVSGRAMMDALVAGERDPQILARLARGVLRRKEPALVAALEGQFTAHHALLLRQILAHLDYLDQAIRALDELIATDTAPAATELALLCTIPGVQRRTAEVLLAEIGPDMTRFPTAAHLASWAGVCPGNHESAGKRLSGRTRKGDRWLRTALIESAWAVSRTKQTYLAALYARVARRRGAKKAVVAVAHRLLISVYHILERRQPYQDLGPAHFDQLHQQRQVRYHLRRLRELGQPIPDALPA